MASSNTYKEFTELYEVWLYRTYMTKPESSFSCFCRRDLGHVICLSLRDGLMITFCRKRLTERPFTSFSSEKQIILPAITECGSSYQLFSLCKSHIKTKAQIRKPQNLEITHFVLRAVLSPRLARAFKARNFFLQCIDLFLPYSPHFSPFLLSLFNFFFVLTFVGIQTL